MHICMYMYNDEKTTSKEFTSFFDLLSQHSPVIFFLCSSFRFDPNPSASAASARHLVSFQCLLFLLSTNFFTGPEKGPSAIIPS